MQLKTTFFVLFSLVLVTTAAIAQTDTIPGATRLAQSPDMDLEMDYLLWPKVPARWMLYAGREMENNIEDRVLGFAQFNNVTYIGLSYKIVSTIAAGASIYSNDGGIHIKLHQRWYFDMRKRIRDGRGGNNFSGQYIGLSEESAIFLGSTFGFKSDFRPRLQLLYGIQHRFRQHVLMDFSVGFSTNRLMSDNKKKAVFFTFTPNFSLSGALFPYVVQKGTRQNVRPRFHEQQRMFKADLLGLFWRYWYSTPFDYHISGREISPYVAFEQKWGHLPVSTEFAIRANFIKLKTIYNYGNDNFRESVFQNIFSLETRWFYNQNRKIAAGKAGNNLSGPFVAVQYQYQRERVQLQYSNIPNTLDAPINYHRTFLLWGYQQRFFKRGFAQLKLGACREAYQAFYPDRTEEITSHRLYSEVRVGLAF